MNVVCIGAHPDDCEVFAGGTALKWVARGARVLFVSLTNGAIGHFEQFGAELARRRRREAEESASRSGVETRVLDYPDGELEPSLKLRKEVVDLIRRWEADIVLTHRPNDYHPDHRYTSIVVQDAAFMVTVPGYCLQAPRRPSNPIFAYFQDFFEKPAPFLPDIVVGIDEVMEGKWAMLDAMESQFYEWLPWLDGKLDEVPNDPESRLAWLKESWTPFFYEATRRVKGSLRKWYGPRRAERIRFAEAFEICEYGRRPSDDEIRNVFPMSL